MIAIIGSSQDDILYFKTKMALNATEPLFGNLSVFRGALGREEVILCAAGEGNYLSSLVTSLIIKTYKPYLVFNIGVASSTRPQLKPGDIFIPERFYFSHVDFSSESAVDYGQIPSLPPYFISDTSLNAKAEATAYRMTSRFVQRGFMLSGEKFYFDDASINSMLHDHYLKEEGIMAYDNCGAGVALACHLSQTALLSLRVISYQLGHEEQRLSYVRKGLEGMPLLGKIVTKFLLDKESE